MRETILPDSINCLCNGLLVSELTWQGVPFRLPKFAIYATIDAPVFDRFFFRHGRKVGLLKLGRYQVPVIDPFRGHLEPAPEHVAVVSHSRGNRFGLYGYPADHIEEDIYLPYEHASVKRIVKDFV